MTLSITLIGCGKMGSAMLSGWLRQNLVEQVRIVDPSGIAEEFQNNRKIIHFCKIEDLPSSSDTTDIYVLAVKPQIMEKVCHSLRSKIEKDSLILSIATGQTIAAFQNYFGEHQPIIRTMPNTPVAVGKGMTVACASKTVTAQQKENTDRLLKATGSIEWIDNESLINSIAALSGSGPAYFFFLTEVLAKAGESLGLPKDFSARLARKTLIGSAALAEHESATDTRTLRENVTSKGGSTACALEVLMQDDALQHLFTQALEAAKKRNNELG